MLTQERLKKLLHYDPDTGFFTWIVDNNNRLKTGDVAGYKDVKGYITITIDGKRYKAHRLAWLYVYASFPLGFLDHKNQNPTDNRIVNLRNATRNENEQNTSTPQANNKSGFKGVSWHKDNKKWLSQIQINNKKISLGYFDTPEEASKSYLKAKRELHPFWIEKKEGV
jgi:hypothetical protein